MNVIICLPSSVLKHCDVKTDFQEKARMQRETDDRKSDDSLRHEHTGMSEKGTFYSRIFPKGV